MALKRQYFCCDGFVLEERFDAGVLFLIQSPEALAERNLRFDILDSFFRKMMPAPTTRLLQDSLDLREIVAIGFNFGSRGDEGDALRFLQERQI